jgi:hypothetical protein
MCKGFDLIPRTGKKRMVDMEDRNRRANEACSYFLSKEKKN